MLKFVRAQAQKVAQDKRLIAGATLVGSMGVACATDPDITAVTAAGASVAVVGAAVFAVKVGVKSWKWFSSTL